MYREYLKTMTISKITLIGFEQASIIHDLAHMINAQGMVAEILHPDEFFKNNFESGSHFMVTVTRELVLRKAIVDKLDNDNLLRYTFVHPLAYIDPTATIGEGTFIAPFCAVAYNATVGKDCTMGPYSMISHKSHIGNGSLIHSGAMVAGSTTIGQYCLLNLRCSVIDKLDICDEVSVGAGSLVTKSIDNPGHYVGSPARRVV